jgi:uncharacterized protein involved in exopolysaccharide biosynthesis
MTVTPQPEPGNSLVGVLIMLLRQRRVIASMMLLGTAVGIAAGLLARRTYTATASFTLQTSDAKLSGVAGLAAQFGIAGLAAGRTQTPDFYADLLTSRHLLRRVADTQYTVSEPGGGRTGTLAELLEIEASSPVLQRERTVDELRDNVGAVSSAKTGLVEVHVRAPAPDLASQVLARMLDLVGDFNLRTRQSQARAERQFVEKRLGEVERELREAEDRLQAFLQRNRDFRNSPQLTFAEERLEREVMMRQQVYSSLAQSYEQSRIDEVRDTPVITMVEAVAAPVEPDSRRLVVRGILGLFLGAMVGVLAALAREFSRSRREAGDASFADLAMLRRQALDDLTRLWPIRRPARP